MAGEAPSWPPDPPPVHSYTPSWLMQTGWPLVSMVMISGNPSASMSPTAMVPAPKMCAPPASYRDQCSPLPLPLTTRRTPALE